MHIQYSTVVESGHWMPGVNRCTQSCLLVIRSPKTHVNARIEQGLGLFVGTFIEQLLAVNNYYVKMLHLNDSYMMNEFNEGNCKEKCCLSQVT